MTQARQATRSLCSTIDFFVLERVEQDSIYTTPLEETGGIAVDPGKRLPQTCADKFEELTMLVSASMASQRVNPAGRDYPKSKVSDLVADFVPSRFLPGLAVARTLSPPLTLSLKKLAMFLAVSFVIVWPLSRSTRRSPGVS